MTPYERAQIFLKAFKMMDGWGVVTNSELEELLGKGPTTFDFETQMKKAEILAKWAIGENTKTVSSSDQD